MNRRGVFLSTLLIAVILFASCATDSRRSANPNQSKFGVLVICGEGLNSTYEDLRVSGVLFGTSYKFAESLVREISRGGTPAHMYVHRDPSIDSRKYVAELLAKDKRDGLVQVSVTHVKNASENSIYVSVSYSTLEWNTDSTGQQSVTTGTGPASRYKLSGKMVDNTNVPFGVYAADFADMLRKAGFIRDE